MKTSFSLRIDKKQNINQGLDQDYFNTYVKQQKIEQFKSELAEFEKTFLELKNQHIGNKEVKLSELLKSTEIAKVLKEIRDRKTKIQKLERAIKDILEDSQNEQ